MTKGCFNCPLNVSDCYRPTCIPGIGVPRMIYTANLQLPGPTIAMCQNDILMVNVTNYLKNQITTIHWHGITQIGTPYMDGVPMVTQCPILPFDKFQYKFRVYQSGTFYWHSHVHFQILDGLAGMFVIRQPSGEDPNDGLYDYDLTEHAILLQDISNVTGGNIDSAHFQVLNDMEFIPSMLVGGRGQQKYFTKEDGYVLYTPLNEYKVKSGFKYRFRLCSNINSQCPMKMFIDGHSFKVIATDGISVKPYETDALEIGQGERYDIVIEANYTTGNFWINFRGTGDFNHCYGTYSAANLKYEGSIDRDLTQLYIPPIIQDSQQKILSDIMSLTSMVTPNPALRATPDKTFYFGVGHVPNYNPLDYNPQLFPWSSYDSSYQMPLPLINFINFMFPPSPMLTQLIDVPESSFCNADSLAKVKNCSDTFCSCVHRVKANVGDLVEVVLINNGNDSDYHTFHLHGYTHGVVAQNILPKGRNTIQDFQALDKERKITRNLENIVYKDSTQIPLAGYIIFRFVADNPG
ncbi:hypothetical protein CHUAL_012625 [Chamberlinius hualienensis]